jgi:hypothetical protein
MKFSFSGAPRDYNPVQTTNRIVTEEEDMKHLAAAAFMVLSATAAHSEDGLLTRLQARRDFDNAVALYKHCTETKPAAACEPERHIMDTYAQALH